MASRWYVVHCRPHGEDTALRNLERQGFSAYLPRCRRRVSHARRVREVLRPFFPRYLFVRLDVEAERWQAVNSTLGVAGLIAEGERPLPVADAVVDDLKAREEAPGVVPEPEAPPFKAGDRVQVVEGPLQGSWGLFVGLDEARRVQVLLSLMGREMRVALPREAVAD